MHSSSRLTAPGYVAAHNPMYTPQVEFDGEAVGEPLNATELARVKGRLTPEMKAKLKARAKLLANKEADDAELKSLELEEQLEAERQAELDQQVRSVLTHLGTQDGEGKG